MERIVLAWSCIPVKQKRPRELAGHTEQERWDWLWKNTTYDKEQLAQISCTESNSLNTRLTSLLGNRILYPDGTVHSFVAKYLRKRTLDLFEKRPSKTGGKQR